MSTLLDDRYVQRYDFSSDNIPIRPEMLFFETPCCGAIMMYPRLRGEVTFLTCDSPRQNVFILRCLIQIQVLRNGTAVRSSYLVTIHLRVWWLFCALLDHC